MILLVVLLHAPWLLLVTVIAWCVLRSARTALTSGPPTYTSGSRRAARGSSP